MKNHYLPKFYLKRFLKNDKKLLCIYFKNIKKYEFKSPTSIGRIKNFYPDKIENFFQNIENMVAPVLLKIDEKKELNKNDKEKIAIFISSMRVRIPFFEKVTITNLNQTKIDFIEDKFSSKEKAKLFIDEVEKKYNKKSDMTVDQLMEFVKSNPKELQIKKSEYFFEIMLGILQKQINFLLKMSWSFLFASRDSSFITSDNPFVLYNLKSMKLNSLFGIADNDVVKIIPLGRSVCMFINKITNNPVLTKYEVYSKKETRLINTFIVDNCDEFLICGDKGQLAKLIKVRLKK